MRRRIALGLTGVFGTRRCRIPEPAPGIMLFDGSRWRLQARKGWMAFYARLE